MLNAAPDSTSAEVPFWRSPAPRRWCRCAPLPVRQDSVQIPLRAAAVLQELKKDAHSSPFGAALESGTVTHQPGPDPQ